MAFFCLLWASLAFGILLGFWLVTNEQKRLVACRVFSKKTRTDAKGDAPTYLLAYVNDHRSNAIGKAFPQIGIEVIR